MLLHSSSTSWTCTFPQTLPWLSLSLLCKHHEVTRHYFTAYKYLSFHLKFGAVDSHISAKRQLSEPLHSSHLTQSNTSPTMSLIPSDFFGGRRTSVFDPFSLDIWDPFLDSSIPPSTALSLPRSDVSREAAQFVSARIDWRETPEAHVFQADLPGMRKEEVRVEVEDGRVLSISGERTREKEEVTDTWHRSERGSGRFSRRFRLPEDVRVDQVKATMENGVLTVVVPKAAAAAVRPEVKPIPITG